MLKLFPKLSCLSLGYTIILQQFFLFNHVYSKHSVITFCTCSPYHFMRQMMNEEMESREGSEKEEQFTSAWLEGNSLQGTSQIILCTMNRELTLQRNVFSANVIFFSIPHSSSRLKEFNPYLIHLWIMISSSLSRKRK